jgi:ABC-type uncharacterized transport system ATPase subunit
MATSLSREFIELLGKIMAQILSILALSTKVMTDRRMSKSIHDLSCFLSDLRSEKFLKKLMGRTDVEDALLRLDSLTKEESLMAVAKILEVADCVRDNVREMKVLAEGTDDRVQVLERVAHSVDQTVNVVKERTQWFPSLPTRVPTLFPIVTQNRNG